MGGMKGIKREGEGGPRGELIDREVDELQRAMAREALAEELKSIDMGKADLNEYREMVARVEGGIEQLKNVLAAIEAKGKERTWIKGKSGGELDDTRLVEAIVGDRNVYKRRGKQQPKAYGRQEKPKRLLFLVDLSASMYRFNTQDQRLVREKELMVMVMEALASSEELRNKYHFEIRGHSGDDEFIDLGCNFGAAPPTPKERFQVIQKMGAVSEYTQSGDHSLEALKRGIKEITAEEADDYFVLLLSDANLSRYGISPAEFALELTRDPKCNAFALFVASFDGEAQELKQSLPVGRAFVTFDTAELPSVFKQIFQSSDFMRLGNE